MRAMTHANPTLISLAPDLWQVRHAFVVNGMPVHTRMTVLRLPGDGLWVHSPVPVDDPLAAQLRALGPVRAVVAPNLAHHLFAQAFVDRFPGATLYLAPGLERKRPDLAGPSLADHLDRWAPELQGHGFGGLPLINETVWFHRSSGTLILTDLCQWWQGDGLPLRARCWARLTGVRQGLAIPLHVRAMVRDRAAAAASARRLLAWPVRRVSVTHDAVIEDDAHGRLARALAPWLRA